MIIHHWQHFSYCLCDGTILLFFLFSFVKREFCFVDDDSGIREQLRMPVSEPEEKEWGQKVGYVRDVDGIVVRMGSPVNPPSPALIHSRWHSYHKLDGIQGM